MHIQISNANKWYFKKRAEPEINLWFQNLNQRLVSDADSISKGADPTEPVPHIGSSLCPTSLFASRSPRQPWGAPEGCILIIQCESHRLLDLNFPKLSHRFRHQKGLNCWKIQNAISHPIPAFKGWYRAVRSKRPLGSTWDRFWPDSWDFHFFKKVIGGGFW